MIRGLSHVNIGARDAGKSLHFYTEVLGLKLAQTIDLPDGRRLWLLDAGGGGMVELSQAAAGAAPTPTEPTVPDAGLRHLAFYVENVNEAHDRLAGLGYKFRLAPPPPGAPGARIALLMGPDGEDIELMEQGH